MMAGGGFMPFRDAVGPWEEIVERSMEDFVCHIV